MDKQQAILILKNAGLSQAKFCAYCGITPEAFWHQREKIERRCEIILGLLADRKILPQEITNYYKLLKIGGLKWNSSINQ